MKILYGLIALVSILFLTLYFWLSPSYLLDKINESQSLVSVRAGQAEGGFLTSYRFKDVRIEKAGKTIIELKRLKIDVNLLKLLVGGLKVDIYSDTIEGYLELSVLNRIKGELNVKNLFFDTELVNIPPEISFTGIMDGRIIAENRSVLFEFRLNNLIWKSFEIEKNSLPLDLFDRAKGGIEIVNNDINIKSIGFEGEKGYARLAGSIKAGKSDIFIEIFPKDFSEPYLIPFYEYKQTQGYYKIPVNIKL